MPAGAGAVTTLEDATAVNAGPPEGVGEPKDPSVLNRLGTHTVMGRSRGTAHEGQRPREDPSRGGAQRQPDRPPPSLISSTTSTRTSAVGASTCWLPSCVS